MKRLFPLAILLLIVAATPVFALDPSGQTRTASVIDDVIRMSQAGVADEAIVSFVVHSRQRFDVSADDVIALTNAKVSKEVIKALVDEAADRKDRKEVRSERTERETVYVRPGYYSGWYDPFYSPFYSPFYDPFWYGPRVSLGFGFGYGHHFGGGRGFRHGRR
jgi:hypothetical protein